jgi:hypothetical protein
MSEEEQIFIEACAEIKGAVQSQMFGKPCFKIGGKAFACFYNKEMVFKLSGDVHEDALSLDASVLFDPSGKGRPMKEWVQVSAKYAARWKAYAKAAARYVSA